MKTILQAIRSVLFLCCMAFFTLTHATIILLCFWLPQNVLQMIVSNWCFLSLWCLKVLCGLSYQVKGQQALEQTMATSGGVVLMCKHQSTMETLILQVILKQKPALVIKKELLNIPFYGWALSRLKPIAINRKEKANAMEQVVRYGTEALQAGRSVLIFPEGTRTPYGQPMLVKRGGINLALEAQAPVIPVAVNTGRFWGKGQLIKQPGEVTVSFGPGITTKGKEVTELQGIVKDWIDQEINKMA